MIGKEMIVVTKIIIIKNILTYVTIVVISKSLKIIMYSINSYCNFFLLIDG